jgi:hypothetical protein
MAGLFLQVQTLEPIPRESPNLYEPWMLPVLLLILAVVAYVRVAYGRRLSRLFNSLWRIQILRQVMREELVFSHRASILLHFNFVLVAALAVYAWMKITDRSIFNLQGFALYASLSGIVAAVYIVKLIITAVLRAVFKDPGLIREYLFEVFLINKAAGILLLPLALALIILNISKAQTLILVIAISALLFIVFRFIQGLRLSLDYKVSGVYIILYLCTLEILPFLVLAKAVLFR